MSALLALYRSTIGKKVAMALSGAVYIGWVLFHILGNLQFHLGPAAMNDYAHKLQSMPALVWFGRTGLLLALLVHVVTAVQLVRWNAGSRSVGYQGPKAHLKTSAAARGMRYGGMFLLLFIVVHLLDLTVRAYMNFPIPLQGSLAYAGADLGFLHGEVFHNMVLSFTNPLTLTFYVLGMVFLGLHLYHGAWSMFQTLGFEGASTNRELRRLAVVIGLSVAVGNLSIVLHGFLAGAVLHTPTITGHAAAYYGVEANVPAALEVEGAAPEAH